MDNDQEEHSEHDVANVAEDIVERVERTDRVDTLEVEVTQVLVPSHFQQLSHNTCEITVGVILKIYPNPIYPLPKTLVLPFDNCGQLIQPCFSK